MGFNQDMPNFDMIVNMTDCGHHEGQSNTSDGHFPVYGNYISIVAVAYSILFLIGICGNTSVLSIVLYIKSVLKAQLAMERENAFLFLIALCLVDLVVIFSLPLTISSLLFGHWLFGTYICKLYWLMESVGKVTSTFVLTAWSFERYMAICHPWNTKLRGSRINGVLLVMLAIFAIILLLPLPYAATLMLTEVHPGNVNIVNFSGAHFYGERCTTSMMDTRLFITFTIYIFIIGYCIPLFLMVMFYSSVLLRIRLQKRKLKQSRIPLKRVTVYTVGLILFYFCCYTPYWVATLMSFFIRDFIRSEWEVYVMYGIHSLPYLNSTFNFIFYALLNSQLRNRKHEVFTVLSGGIDTETATLTVRKSKNKLSSEEDRNFLLSASRFMAPLHRYRNGRINTATTTAEYSKLKKSATTNARLSPDRRTCSLEMEICIKATTDSVNL